MTANKSFNSDDKHDEKKSALVFGASGEQGQAVIKGLLETNEYFPIYAASHDISTIKPISSSTCTDDYISPTIASRATKYLRLITVDLSDSSSVKKTLLETNPNVIFLVTTTDLPPTDMAAAASLKECEEEEYEAIKSFFDVLRQLHSSEKKEKHIIFSTLDDVQSLNEENPFIKPFDDGSVVPHYSGKGRAGKYALKLLENVEGLTLTLLTLPFLHSNFVASTIPLPNNGQTQWSISACFGDSAIDMFSVSDLAYIVPSVLNNPMLYNGYDIRVSAEKITLDEVASIFADLFGKDVIYNPLTVEEMAEMDIPGAPAFAQMCQFLANEEQSSHDIDVTETVMFPRKPQLFKDWLLTHSDDQAFEQVGLALDGTDITTVTVFGATGMQGASVVKGLLADTRKVYSIRAVTRDMKSEKAQAIYNLDPDRITLIQADFDDTKSCQKAVEGVDGVFLNTDFYSAGMDLEAEEQHAKNVIDACEASNTVKHLVFSTLESVEEMNRELDLGLDDIEDGSGKKSTLPQFDSKARAAAYARTKKLSCTYVLMPVYSESFFELMAPEVRVDEETGEKTHVIHIPVGKKREGEEEEEEEISSGDEGDETRVMCMSVEELGPAVANIFDSYQVYAGHEIGLVTDFVTMSEAAEMIEDIFFSNDNRKKNKKEGQEERPTDAPPGTPKKVERKNVAKDTWVEKRDTHAKDLGQMFRYYSKSDAVKKRRSVAKTLDLVPDARPLRKWLEENRDNVLFRQKLGLR